MAASSTTILEATARLMSPECNCGHLFFQIGSLFPSALLEQLLKQLRRALGIQELPSTRAHTPRRVQTPELQYPQLLEIDTISDDKNSGKNGSQE